jgi:hypothetical protein
VEVGFGKDCKVVSIVPGHVLLSEMNRHDAFLPLERKPDSSFRFVGVAKALVTLVSQNIGGLQRHFLLLAAKD